MKKFVFFIFFGLIGCHSTIHKVSKQQKQVDTTEVVKDTSVFHPEISMDSLNRLDDALGKRIAKKDSEIHQNNIN